MILVIDNYDSFTYNLVQYLGELGASPRVARNDAITVEDALALAPSHVLISPGPGTPEDGGISAEVMDAFSGRVPILGVCLGHQILAHRLGGRVVRAALPIHGKTNPVEHDGTGPFAGLSSPVEATRYHSLVVDPETVPVALRINAWTFEADGSRTIMGLAHRSEPTFGVQFHPESIATAEGKRMIHTFLESGLESGLAVPDRA